MSQISYGTFTITDLTDGKNSVVILLYKRAGAAPASGPTASLTYNFENAELTPSSSLGGWVQDLSDVVDGSEPIWFVSATAGSTESTYIIASNEWSTPKKFVADGVGVTSIDDLYWLQTIPLYTVTYSYDNTPSGAPSLPSTASYPSGTTVQVASQPQLTGYTFSGWYRNGSLITGETFTMPSTDVSITGYWTAKTLRTVTYQYTNAPSGVTAPSSETHYSGDVVNLPTPQTVTNYTFDGWTSTTTGVTIQNNKFTMPDRDVIIKGNWTSTLAPTYTVTYQYTNAPSGVSPPTQQSYQQGTTVTLPTPSSVSGYTFNGWTSSQVTISNNRFTMPAYAVTITGSWTSTSPSSGPTRTFASKTLTSASNTIQFTNLQGEPTSFVVVSQGNLATGASPWKTAVVAFNGTSVYGCYITNTSGQQMTASNTVFSKSYSNGTLTITGSGSNPDVEFQPNEYMLVYSYGGTTSDVQSITQTVGSGATSITFTGLTGEPSYFSCVFEGGYYDAVNSSWGGGYQRVIGVVYDGDSTFGMAMGANAVASSSYWSYTYSNGSLTITSQGTNAGGYFHQATGVDYRLTYIVDNQLRSVNNTKGFTEIKGETKSDDEIEIKSDENENIVLTKGEVLRAGANDSTNTPGKPTSEVTRIDDVTDRWTLAIPTYVRGGTYFTCLQIHYSDGTVDWSEPKLDQVLTDVSASALTSYEATSLLDGHFVYNGFTTTNLTPHSANIIENNTSTPNSWGYNVNIGSNGIKLRYNEIDHAVWTKDGLTFLDPKKTNGVYVQGDPVASLTTGDGLVLSQGGISAGQYNASATDSNQDFVYLSSKNYGSKISSLVNDNSKTDWRLLVGNKFGVDKSGNLYASNANISGKITVNAGSDLSEGLGAYSTTESMENYVTGLGYQTAGNVSDAINSIQIGGRNLWPKTKNYEDYNLTVQSGTAITITSGEPTDILNFPNVTAGSTTIYQAAICRERIPYSAIRNKPIIFSMYIKVANGVTTAYFPQFELYEEKTGGTRIGLTNTDAEVVGTGNWEKVTKERLINDDTWTLTSTPSDFSTCYVRLSLWKSYTKGYGAGFQAKELKLEVGNKATDWSPAPEDVQNEIDNIQIGGRNLLQQNDVEIDQTNSNTAAAYRIHLTEPLEINQTYVLQLWDVAISNGTSSSLDNIGIDVKYTDDSNTITLGGWSGNTYFTGTAENATSSRLILIFEPNEQTGIATIISGGNRNSSGSINSIDNTKDNFYIELYNINSSANSNRLLNVETYKLEKGTKPTEWSVAPEDINDDITEASNVNQNLINSNNALLQELIKTINFEDWLKNNGDWIQIIDPEALALKNTTYYNLEIEFSPVQNIVTEQNVYKLFTKENNVYEPILDLDAVAVSGVDYYEHSVIIQQDQEIDNYTIVSVTVGTTNVYGLYTLNDNVYRQILNPDATAETGISYYKISSIIACNLKDIEPGVTPVYGSYVLDLVTTPLSNFLNSHIILDQYGIKIQGYNIDSELQIYNNVIQIRQGSDIIASFGTDIRLGDQQSKHIKLTSNALEFFSGKEEDENNQEINKVAFINNELLSIANGELINSLKIGPFQWQKISDNRITLIYTG